MRSLHLEKKGLRGLAIAESFKENSKKSIFSGVVMRRDFLIDGFVFGSSTLEGDDATDTILKMYYDLNRPDISYVLISGLIVSMYNIINIKKLADTLQLPIIGISFNDSDGLEDAIKHHFPNSYESKIIAYRKLGNRETILLDNSHVLYVRKEGCTLNEVKHLLNNLILHGSVPEPIRVSQLLAKTLLQKGLSF
ncbi:endonuclease dU [Nitrosopumilus sp. S4]